MAIIRAIVGGERNPKVLSELLVAGAKAKERTHCVLWKVDGPNTICLRLRKQSRHMTFNRACGCATGGSMRRWLVWAEDLQQPKASQLDEKRTRVRPERANKRDTRVDPTTIDGIEASVAAVLVCELGADLSKFKTEKHIASYLGLSAENKITGGNIKSGRTRKVKHRAANALRMAAQSMHSSKSAMGAYYRRFKARIGAAKSNNRYGAQDIDPVLPPSREWHPLRRSRRGAHNERFRNQRIRSLTKQAGKLGTETNRCRRQLPPKDFLRREEVRYLFLAST